MSTMKKRHRMEALASVFVVGLGQILKGEGKKGLKLILAFYFFLPAAVYVSLILNAYLFLIALGLALIIGILLWIYNIRDAYIHETLV
jgi:hypothetical protein